MAEPETQPQATGETQPEPVVAPVAAPEPTLADLVARIEALQTQNDERYQTVVQHLSRQPVPAAPATTGDVTDDELWLRAQQGDRRAFEMYQERIADRRVQTQIKTLQSSQAVQAQLQSLYAQYPELRDPQHPLTQRAMAFKQVLVQMGSPQQSPQTDLDAILRAVADSRALWTQPNAPAPRAGGTHAHTAPTPSPTARPAPVRPIGEREAALASRMGIKDPAAAMKRFEERQAQGRSSVSPLIAASVKEA